MVEPWLYLIAGLALGAVAVWFFGKQRQGGGGKNKEDLLHSLHQLIGERLDNVSQQLDNRLRDNVRAINESKAFLTDRVSATERTVRAVSASLGKLEQATDSLQRANEEIISFQHMLKSPKIRGSFGEVLLSNLLSEVLPRDWYELQYAFRESGEIADAIIRMQDGYIVAVDAKFPLANFQVFVDEQNEAVRNSARKTFVRDVKKHVTDIAKKYISPRQKTLDFAFMYIPIETVYYETVMRDQEREGIWEFCSKHKVVPVSPNSFLAYLQTVLIGLRGMKIQQQTKEILQSLGQVRHDFGQFARDFTMVGTHLTNAKNRFDDSARQLDKFSNRLEQIEETKTPGLGEGSTENPA